MDKKELQEENKRLRRELFQAQKSMQEFIYAVSHDFEPPLRSVTSFSEMLKRKLKGALDSKTAGYLDFIYEGGQEMQKKLDALHAFSRVISEGKKASPVILREMVSRVLDTYEEKERPSLVQMNLKSLPVLSCDEEQIETLFSILIDNACRYKKEGQDLALNIFGKNYEEEVEVSVSDNGVGVLPGERENIFTIFKTLGVENKSVGAGLAIAKRIVERHRGVIRAKKSPEGGTSIIFTLSKKGLTSFENENKGEEQCNLKQA